MNITFYMKLKSYLLILKVPKLTTKATLPAEKRGWIKGSCHKQLFKHTHTSLMVTVTTAEKISCYKNCHATREATCIRLSLVDFLTKLSKFRLQIKGKNHEKQGLCCEY